VAAATGALPEKERDALLSLGNAVTAAFLKLVDWILLLAPVGVFALAAPVTARAGWAMLQALGAFILAVLVGLALLVFGAGFWYLSEGYGPGMLDEFGWLQFLLLWFHSRRKCWRHHLPESQRIQRMILCSGTEIQRPGCSLSPGWQLLRQKL